MNDKVVSLIFDPLSEMLSVVDDDAPYRLGHELQVLTPAGTMISRNCLLQDLHMKSKHCVDEIECVNPEPITFAVLIAKTGEDEHTIISIRLVQSIS